MANRLQEIQKRLKQIDRQWFTIPEGERQLSKGEALGAEHRYLQDEAEKIIGEPTLPKGFKIGHPSSYEGTVRYAVHILPATHIPVKAWGKIVKLDENLKKNLAKYGVEFYGEFLQKIGAPPHVRYAGRRDFIIAKKGHETEFNKWYGNGHKESPKPSAETKEPWKMTKEEFIASKPKLPAQKPAGLTDLQWDMAQANHNLLYKPSVLERDHRIFVEIAVKSGKPVPAEVLKDYPELGKAEAKTAAQMTKEEYFAARKEAAKKAGLEFPEEPKYTPVKNLPDAELWRLYLKPIERDMPQDMKDYLGKVKEEFDKRDIKLMSSLSAIPTPRGRIPKELASLAQEARKYDTFEDFEHAFFSEDWKRKWRHEKGVLGDVAVMGFPKATDLATEGKYVISGREGIRKFWESAKAPPKAEAPAKAEGMEEIKVGLDILKRPPKVSPLKGKSLTEVEGISGRRMRVPLNEVEVTHPMAGANAFWYKNKRVVLTPEQQRHVLPEAPVKAEEGPKPQKEIAILQPKPGAKQSNRAIAIDRSLLAKQVVAVDDTRWLKRPNRFDVRGVDTPGSHRIIPGVAYTDKGAKRLARRHHKGWKRVKFT